jgi:hypothetical protein
VDATASVFAELKHAIALTKPLCGATGTLAADMLYLHAFAGGTNLVVEP